MDDVLTLPGMPDEEENGPDLEPTYEPVMQCEGYYEVDPIPGGKRFQGSWLVLDDGQRYLLSYRPLPKYFRYVDKRVSVTGRPYMPGRDTQHIMATHFQVDSIKLAPGEVPYTEIPAQLPAPPLLRTVREICGRAGRWGQVVGRLVALEDDPNTHFYNAHLVLEDGTLIIARHAAESLWRSYLGSTITVISRVEVKSSDTVSAVDRCEALLIGWYALCSGVVNRCGMDSLK